MWYDATERFFNVDNTFVVTFKHLFTKPEKVIAGYINGVRKKYLNPISYFTIAITLGGLFVYLMNEFFPEALSYQFQNVDPDTLKDSDKLAFDFQKKWNNYLFKYQSFFYILMLPFLSLISRLVFINRKQFNISEHFVINIYAYSQMSMVINITYILILWSPKLVYYASLISFPLQILYFTWVLKRIFNLNLKQTILKLLFFLIILGAVFGILIVAIGIYLALFTDTFANLATTKS